MKKGRVRVEPLPQVWQSCAILLLFLLACAKLLLEQLFEPLAAGLHVDHFAILAYENHRRNADRLEYAVFDGRRWLIGILVVANDNPRELPLLEEAVEIVAILVKIDADDLKAPVVILLVHFP